VVSSRRVWQPGIEGNHGAAARRVALQLAPAQQRPGAGQQLAQLHRLGDVVVARQLQAQDAVDLAVLLGDEDDADRAGRADLAGQVEAVAIRQLDVDEDQVCRPLLQRPPALRPRRRLLDLESLLGEIAGDHRAGDRIVLHHDQTVAPRPGPRNRTRHRVGHQPCPSIGHPYPAPHPAATMRTAIQVLFTSREDHHATRVDRIRQPLVTDPQESHHRPGQDSEVFGENLI
jgi:hypothetical protein